MELRFEALAMLYSNLGDGKSDAGHIKHSTCAVGYTVL